MSFRPRSWCALGLATFVSLVLFSPPSLRAQRDSAMMKHDSALMPAESGKMKDKMMGDKAMEPNLMFMGAAGHQAAGDYEITEVNGKQQIKLTPDFAVDEGPELYLVLANAETPDARSIYLAKLKRATGSQSYDIPKGTDLSRYTKLLVWSKRSNGLIASADFASSGHMMSN